jgi:hypothetical protein
MTKSKVEEVASAYPAAEEPSDPIQDAEVDQSDIVLTAATVAVVGVGVAVFEAALLPGVILGVAAALVPKALPNIGAALNPLVKSTVRGAYKFGKKTREFVAETQEHVHDIVAEANASEEAKLVGGKSAASASAS